MATATKATKAGKADAREWLRDNADLTSAEILETVAADQLGASEGLVNALA